MKKMITYTLSFFIQSNTRLLLACVGSLHSDNALETNQIIRIVCVYDCIT